MAANREIVRHLEATARYLRATPSNVDIMVSRFFDPDFRTDAHGQPLTHQIFFSPAIRSLLNQQALEVVEKIKANNLGSFKDYSIEPNMNQIRRALLAEIRDLFLNEDGSIRQQYIDAFAYEVDGEMVSGEEAIRIQFAEIIMSAEGLPDISNEEEFLKKFGHCLANSYLAHCEQYLSECVSKEIGANQAHSNALDVWHIKGVPQRSALIDKFDQSSKKSPKKSTSRTRFPSFSSLFSSDSSASVSDDKPLPLKSILSQKSDAVSNKKRRPTARSAPASLATGKKKLGFKDTVEVVVYQKEKVEREEVQDAKGIETIQKDELRRSLTEYKTGVKGISQANPLKIEGKIKDSNQANDLANDIEPYDPKTLMPSFRHNFRRIGLNFLSQESIHGEIQAICDEVKEYSSLFDILERAIREENISSLEMITLYQLKERLDKLRAKIEILNTKERPEYDNKPLDWALFESSIDNLTRLKGIVCEEMRRRLFQPDLTSDQIQALLNRTEEEFILSSISEYSQEMVDENRKEIFDFISNLCAAQFVSKQQHLFILNLLNEDSVFEKQFWKILQRKDIKDVEAVIFQFVIFLNHAPNIIALQKKHISLLEEGFLSEADFIRGCVYLRQEEISDEEYLYVYQQWSQGNHHSIEAIIMQYREENAAPLLPEVEVNKAPVEKRPVALLDIDHTLYFQDKNQKIVLNEQLLENLKQRGIQDVYLFTDMTFRLSAITERMQLVLDLEARGFKVHGIITPADLMLDSVLPEDIEALHQYNPADPSKVSRMAERAMKAYQSEQEVPKNEARIGRAFKHCVEKFGSDIKRAVKDKNISDVNARDIIVQDYFNENGLLEDVRAFDNKSKVVVNGWIGPVAQSLGYQHPKGCMLTHFKKHKPDWVSDIIVADDLEKVIKTVQEIDPAIKTLHITGAEMDEAVYTQALGEKNPNPTEPSVRYPSFTERIPFNDKKLSVISAREGISEIALGTGASVAIAREHLKTVIAATNPNPYSEPNPRAFVDPFMPAEGFSSELQIKARQDFLDLYNSMVGFHNDDANFALYQQNPEEYIMELCVLKQENGKPTSAVIKQRHLDLFEKMYRYIFNEQGNYTESFRGEFSGKSVDQYLAHCQLSKQDLFLQYVQNYHDTVNELFKQHAGDLDSDFEMLFNSFHTEFFGRDLATAPNSIACDAFFCDKLREQINRRDWLASLDLMALFQLKKEIAALRGMSLEDKKVLIDKVKMEQWHQLLSLKEDSGVLLDDSRKTLGQIVTEEDEYTYLNDMMDFYVEQKQEIPGLKELVFLFREKRIGTDAFKFIFRQFSLNPDFALAMINAALEGISPLHYAVRENDVKLAQFLLNQGKSPQSSQDDKRRAPLHYAIQQSNIDMAELLVLKGADVNARDFLGKTPLHYAIQQANLKAIQFLLMKGADPSIKDNTERTAFHCAMERKEKAIIDLLVNFVDKDYKTLLHYAVLEGDVELARHLIEQGAVIDSEDDEGKTPLHYAVGKDNEQLIALLIDGGANIEAKDKDGNTPLHDAANKDNAKTFYLLFNRSRQFTSATIQRAAEALSGESVEEKSAYISQRLALIPINIPVIQNNEGKTPLDCAGEKIRQMASGRIIMKAYDQFLDRFHRDIKKSPQIFETLLQRFRENMPRLREVPPSDKDSQELLEMCLDLSGRLQYDLSYYENLSSKEEHPLRYGEALLLESLVEALSIRASDDFKKMPQYQYLLKMLALKKEISADAAKNKSVARRKALLAQMVTFDRTVRDSGLSAREQNEAYERVNTKFKAPALSSESAEISSSSFVGKGIAGAFMVALGSMMRMSSLGVSAISYGEKLIKESQTDSAWAKIQKSSVNLLESAYHIKTEALSSVTGTKVEMPASVDSKSSVVCANGSCTVDAVMPTTPKDSVDLELAITSAEKKQDLDTEEEAKPTLSVDSVERGREDDFADVDSPVFQGYHLKSISSDKAKGKADKETIYFEVADGYLHYSIMITFEQWLGGTLDIAISERVLDDTFLQENRDRILAAIEIQMENRVAESSIPPSPSLWRNRKHALETVQEVINREDATSSAVPFTALLPADSPLSSGSSTSPSLQGNTQASCSNGGTSTSTTRFRTPGTKSY